MRVLITGAAGLVGTALATALEERGHSVVRFDRLTSESQDVQNLDSVAAALASEGGCDGVVHLAAISRVTWAQDAPEEAWANNVVGTENVLRAAQSLRVPPWVLYASSREVYGPLAQGVVITEDAPLAPMNAYARTKVEGERMMVEARSTGLRTAVVRYSNIYGAASDHVDRVIPAFVRAALAGTPLTVEGGDNAFDFVHLDDAIAGTLTMTDRLSKGVVLPPIQLVTEVSTSLSRLAEMALGVAAMTNGAVGEVRSEVRAGTPRQYDVRAFAGSGARAREMLGWGATVGLREGLGRLATEIHALG